MNWVETFRAAALATLAERATPARRATGELGWHWNAHDVWLSRPRRSRARIDRSTVRDPSSPPDPVVRP